MMCGVSVKGSTAEKRVLPPPRLSFSSVHEEKSEKMLLVVAASRVCISKPARLLQG